MYRPSVSSSRTGSGRSMCGRSTKSEKPYAWSMPRRGNRFTASGRGSSAAHSCTLPSPSRARAVYGPSTLDPIHPAKRATLLVWPWTLRGSGTSMSARNGIRLRSRRQIRLPSTVRSAPISSAPGPLIAVRRTSTGLATVDPDPHRVAVDDDVGEPGPLEVRAQLLRRRRLRDVGWPLEGRVVLEGLHEERPAVVAEQVEVVDVEAATRAQDAHGLAHVVEPLPLVQVHEHDGAVDEVDGLGADRRQVPAVRGDGLDVVVLARPFAHVPQHVLRDVGGDPLLAERRDRRADATDAGADLEDDVIGKQAGVPLEGEHRRLTHLPVLLFVGVPGDGELGGLDVTRDRVPHRLVVGARARRVDDGRRWCGLTATAQQLHRRVAIR